jgi:dTDP-glucose 4,6-dehydratase
VARLLVTGGAGFIGANFVHYWLRQHPADTVVVLDALTYAGNRANLAGIHPTANYRFEHGDINDRARVVSLLREASLDTIVHFAAESHVDRSITGPDAFVRTNVNGTHSLLEAAREVWLEQGQCGDSHRFHHVSTDEVYGSLDRQAPPFTEVSAYAPNSPYAASKAGSDFLVRAYANTYGLCTSVTNCSNNYGPLQFPEKLIPRMITNALQGSRLPVYGRGENVRDWLHVEDHCRGIEAVLLRGAPGRTYNIGGGAEMANIDLVRRLCQIIDAQFACDPALTERFPLAPPACGGRSEELIEFVADRPGHDFRYAIDSTRLHRELGVSQEIALDAGLIETVRWYLAHEQWWRSVLDGSYREESATDGACPDA